MMAYQAETSAGRTQFAYILLQRAKDLCMALKTTGLNDTRLITMLVVNLDCKYIPVTMTPGVLWLAAKEFAGICFIKQYESTVAS